MMLESFSLGMGELQATANHVKDSVVDQLVIEKMLTPEQGELLRTEYGVIIIRKGWFTKLIEKTFNLGDDADSKTAMYYKLVKLTN